MRTLPEKPPFNALLYLLAIAAKKTLAQLINLACALLTDSVDAKPKQLQTRSLKMEITEDGDLILLNYSIMKKNIEDFE